MDAVLIKITNLHPNKGQIPGVPANPRFIMDEPYEKLKQSIIDDPEMLELRELLVYPQPGKKGHFVIIGGNMRYRACKEIGFKEVPCKVLDEKMTPDKLQAILIKDNVSGGSWDMDLLANEWDKDQVESWGVDLPDFAMDVDYDILNEEDVSDQLIEMTNGVKKAIQIEFEPEHYGEAYELCSFWRHQGANIGYMILQYLREEKKKYEIKQS